MPQPHLDAPEIKPAVAQAPETQSALQRQVSLLRHSTGSMLAGATEVADTPGKSALMGVIDFGIGVGLTAVTHNRYAGVMVKRALAVGFGTAVAGDLVYGSTADQAWGAIKDVAHNPQNFNEDATKLGRALGHTIADGVIGTLGTLGGQVAGTRLSKIENLLVEDSREKFLRTGNLEKFYYPAGQEPAFLKEFEESGMRTGVVSLEGKSVPVISRDTAFRGNYMNRFRKERAMYKLGDLMGTDTGSVANAMKTETADGHNYKMWIQENLGPSLQNVLEERTGVKDGANGALHAWARHLETKAPALKNQLGKTYFQRLLAGETDNHLGNVTVLASEGRETTASIDAVRSFPSTKTPTWTAGFATDPIKQLYAGKPVDPEDLQKLGKFVERFDTFKGRAELGTLDLSKKEVEGYMARAKWFLKHGIYPES